MGVVTTDHSTVADFSTVGWCTSPPGRSPTTIRDYRDKIKRLKEKLGRILLSKLTAQRLDLVNKAWLDEGLHPTTIHHLHAVLSAAPDQAVKWSVVPYAATKSATPPPLRTRPKATPSPDVIQQLIAGAEERGQPVLVAVIALAATTGARKGSSSALRWSDADLDAAVLYIRRTIKHADGSGWVVGETKTHAQRRIALDAFSAEVLRRHHDDAMCRATNACVDLVADGYVLTFDPTGATPMKPDSLGQAFGRLCIREGVAGVSLHTLQHFSASVLVASGRDVRTIAGRLGHADATTTLRVYSHMIEGRHRDAAEFLGGLPAANKTAALDKG
jgi:integrase